MKKMAPFTVAMGLGLAATAHAQIELVPRATGLQSPVQVTNAGDGSGILYVVEQPGRIVGILPQTSPPPVPVVFLDIQSLVLAGGEQGLLGLAFHPNFPATPYFFVNYTCRTGAGQPECTGAGDTIIARFRVGTNGVADAASRRTLLVIDQPFSNHNAGDLKFGADGFLYIPMGDGGSANDPSCFAQRDDSLLGKILRIDVDQNVNTPPYYGIPPGNPYIGGGDPRDEVFARGLRNPFRFSFDRQTGDMFIGDVGQGAREEIDFQAAGTGAGANYGWKVMEGTLCNTSASCPGTVPPCNSPSFTPPIIQVDHNTGDCAIIGGFRYRGTGIPAIAGRYLHSDNCSGRIRGATETAPGVWSDAVLIDTDEAISGFGEDEAGEVYVTALGGTLYRIRAAGGVAGLSVNDVDISPEGNAGTTTAALTVTLGAASAQQVTVQYATANGSATAGPDYVAVSGILTFAPSVTTRTVTVSVVGDTLDEANEAFFVNLSNPVNAIVDDGQGIGTIVDDDPSPALSISGCTVTEGNVGSTPCTFGVTLSPASGRTVFADYQTANGTATAGSDYTATSGTLTFAPGSTTASVAVPVLGDPLFEPNETFTLALSNLANATGGGSATGTIDNDDPRERGLAHGVAIRGTLAPPLPILFNLRQDPFASYEVVLDEAAGDATPGLRLDRMEGTTVVGTSVAVGTGSARALRWQNATSATIDTQQIRISSPACGTNCGADDVYRVRAYDTTGRIPRFNNFGSQVTVLILQNTTDRTIASDVRFWNPLGSELYSQPFTLQPHTVQVMLTQSIVQLMGESGSITITHNGGYGALAGKSVALEPATGYSFDSPMTYRPR